MTDDWQPIDTAPKDGTEILAWSKMTGAITVFWDDDLPTAAGWTKDGVRFEAAEDPAGWVMRWDYSYVPAGILTHWRTPLTEPEVGS